MVIAELQLQDYKTLLDSPGITLLKHFELTSNPVYYVDAIQDSSLQKTRFFFVHREHKSRLGMVWVVLELDEAEAKTVVYCYKDWFAKAPRRPQMKLVLKENN